MLNCLAAAIPGGERVISAEEVFELRFDHPDWVPMQTRQSGLEGNGEVRLRDLVKESLRMRPSRMMGRQIEGGETSIVLRRRTRAMEGLGRGDDFVAEAEPIEWSVGRTAIHADHG